MPDSKDTVTRTAKKTVLPAFVLTEVCEATDDEAVRLALPSEGDRLEYYERPKLADTGQRRDGKPKWKASRFNLFPVVLESTGLPWPEANVYIVSRLENASDPSMTTYDGIAEDLAAYRRFLDEEEIDWQKFPAQRLARPTYRYSASLSRAVSEGKIAASSGKRRMSSVIGFYNWVIKEEVIKPAHLPWREKDVLLTVTGNHGFELTKHVTTTDVSIKIPKQQDPYDGCIDDGGKLRPLPVEEQRWVLDGLFAQGNTEMTLIHLLALATGARIQTVLTFRVKNLRKLTEEQLSAGEIRCPIGPGTGIDTKRDKRMSLHIPLWLYRMLQTYSTSERARQRRTLAKGGDVDNQYLFLSKYGTPFYQSKEDSRAFDETNELRHALKGQSVRKYMSEVVIPYVRAKHSASFHYRFHDLRASFGMNLTDNQLKLVEQGKATLSNVREFVKVRMGHSSAVTTDLYLTYRGNIAQVAQVTDDHDDYLRDLAEMAGVV